MNARIELTAHAAEIRLAQYGERGKPYESGNEKALYEIALTLKGEVDRLRKELAKYVGHEPTIAEEMAYLNRCLDAVHDVCDETEKQATRWEHPLPVPEWVADVRAAASGERPGDPNDRRHRIYIDGRGDAWMDVTVEADGTTYIAQIEKSFSVGTPMTEVAERTGSLREIGRCW